LRHAVERVLADPIFARDAASLSAALARYGGPARAVELIEDLVPAPAPLVGRVP
jgi:UDP:flavonoid glycosyltransferase YjiC (YdhE family)